MQNGQPWQRFNGDRAKHSFRHLIRKEKWTVIDVDSVYEDWHTPVSADRDDFVKLRNWCEQTFKQDEFASTLDSDHGTMTPGRKRFAFKKPSDATLFALKWK